jgi:hypothetical protein
VRDAEGFVRRWRQHFVDVMRPRFLPPLWRVAGPERTEENLKLKLTLKSAGRLKWSPRRGDHTADYCGTPEAAEDVEATASEI